MHSCARTSAYCAQKRKEKCPALSRISPSPTREMANDIGNRKVDDPDLTFTIILFSPLGKVLSIKAWYNPIMTRAHQALSWVKKSGACMATALLSYTYPFQSRKRNSWQLTPVSGVFRFSIFSFLNFLLILVFVLNLVLPLKLICTIFLHHHNFLILKGNLATQSALESR